MDDLKGRQELYRGFGDTMVRGVELALTLAIFAGMGYGLDRLLGIVPVLTVVFFLLGAVGLAVKTYYAYEAEMQAHDAAAPWGHRDGAPRGTSEGPPPRRAGARGPQEGLWARLADPWARGKGGGRAPR